MNAALLVIAALVVAGANGAFHCLRDTTLCKHSSTCESSGECDCPAGREGYDCSVLTTGTTDALCTDNGVCQNGATCYAESGAAQCLCDPAWTGPTCDTRLYTVDCTDTEHSDISITALLTDLSTFVGEAYVPGRKGTAACELTCTNGVCTGTIPFTSSECGDADDVSGRKSRPILFKYSQLYETNRDEIVTFICATTNELTVNSEVIVNFAPSAFTPVEADLSPEDSDVSLTLGSGTVNMGDDITATIDLTASGLTKWAQLSVKTCWVSEAATGGGVNEEFITNFCLNNIYSVVDPTVSRTGTSHAVVFAAPRLLDNDALFLICTVKLCAVATDCDPTGACTLSGDTGVGRKKRQAESGSQDGETERTVYAKLRVIDPFESKSVAIEKSCSMTGEMIATVAALAVGLVLVLLLCIILIVKAILRRKQPMYKGEDMSSTGHLPNLPHYK